MRFFVWLFRAFVFFALFAFSLNNQQTVTVHWFFGYVWNAPLVIVVLAAFAAGTVVGVLAMTPNWWRQRRRATRRTEGAAAQAAAAPAPVSAPDIPDGI